MGILTSFFIIISALLGTPLFIIMALAGLFAVFLTGGELSVIGIEIYKISGQATILTIPLFTFAGYLIAESRSPIRLLKFTDAALGWLPGGVAIVALVICAFFTAFTGASGVTIIALGGLLYPILSDEGYSDKFNLGLITSSGSLGLLFPPSLPLILYGLVANVDIENLFKAGILPGILLILTLSLWAIYNGRNNNKTRKAFKLSKLMVASKECWLELLLPIGILFGIYSGKTTITEAAAVTAFYAIIVECFIYRDLSFLKDVPKIIIDSMSLVSSILLILCCALGFTNFLVDEEIPMRILESVQGFITNKYTFLLFLNFFLLIVGSLMDIFSAIIVVVPLIIPIAKEFQIDPIHLAIIFLTNLEIGYLTPPVGINLFISSFRFQKPILQLYRASLPFLIILLLTLIIITYVPLLSLWWK